MSKANRAAQFAPFDALNGLQKALREKEEKHLMVDRAELSKETHQQLGQKTDKIKKGNKTKGAL